MVVPTRSRNSSWRSLWDLQGTQAPQLRQSNNTLGGEYHKDRVECGNMCDKTQAKSEGLSRPPGY